MTEAPRVGASIEIDTGISAPRDAPEAPRVGASIEMSNLPAIPAAVVKPLV